MGMDSFIMYDSYGAQFDMLTDEEAGKIIKAVYEYRRGNDVGFQDRGLQMLFSIIQEQMRVNDKKYQETCNKRKNNGKQGGRPPKAKEIDTDENQMVNENQMVIEKPNGLQETICLQETRYDMSDMTCNDMTCNDNDMTCNEMNDMSESENNKTSKPTRHRYGEYQNVLLSDDELAKVQAEFPADWEKRIERLSEYMASTGKSYKSHLATIRAWARKDKPTEQAGSYDYTQKREGEPWWARYERMQDYILEHAPDKEWQRQPVPDDKTSVQETFNYKQRVERMCSEVIREQRERGEEIIINGKRA